MSDVVIVIIMLAWLGSIVSVYLAVMLYDGDFGTNDFDLGDPLDPANPASLLSPANPANPASPLH